MKHPERRAKRYGGPHQVARNLGGTPLQREPLATENQVLLQHVNDMLELLIRETRLSAVLDGLCLAFERLVPGSACSILLLDEERLHLSHGAAPSLPLRYRGIVDGLTIGPRVGSCGTAAYTGAAVVTQDIAADQRWEPYRGLVEPFGFRACWSVPVKGSIGQVLGTFGAYYPVPHEPSAFERRLMDGCVPVAALAIERDAAVQRLSEPDEQYRHLVEVLPDALVVHSQGIIRYVNPALVALIGQRSSADLVGRPIWDYIHPDHHEAVASSLNELSGAGEPGGPGVPREVKLLRPRGEEVLAEVLSVPLVYHGEPAVQTVIRDLTESKKLERGRANLSLVSHELRSPLASIVGFAELLLTRPSGEEQRREFLTIIEAEGRRLGALINQILDLDRLERRREDVVPRPTDLRTLLSFAASLFGQDPTHPVVVDLPTDLPLVQADPSRIQQVLANLLANARKYSPAGGQIRVTAQVLERSQAESGHLQNHRAAPGRQLPALIEVAVQDQGLGLPAEALPLLFEPFYRVSAPDRSDIPGTGLGLAISREIIRSHGGELQASSPGMGLGSTFAFTLQTAAMPGPAQVLVVEDDAAFGTLISAALAVHGLSVVLAPNAETALAELAAVQPRVIVLDLILPGVHGERFLRHLRQQGGGGADATVVVVTVEDLTAEARASLESLGVADIFQKGPTTASATAKRVLALVEAGP